MTTTKEILERVAAQTAARERVITQQQCNAQNLDTCCAHAVAVQDNPIFKGKRLRCDSCGRETIYPDAGIGWEYVTPEPPAPDAGETWLIHKNKREIVSERGFYVAFVTDESTAERIVTDHHLAGLVPGLLEALRLIEQMHDKTLLGDSISLDPAVAYQHGANAAFQQIAEIARTVLKQTENDHYGNKL